MVQKINTLVVGLSYTDLDIELLKYTNHVAQVIDIEKVYFVHIVKIHIPDEVMKEFPNLEKDAISERKSKVEAMIKKHCREDKEFQYSVEVIRSSNKPKGLIQAVKEFDADLILVGRNADKPKDSLIIQRLARRCPCQILIMPEGTIDRLNENRNIRKLLVPVDFSEYSAMALEQAISIARGEKNNIKTEIICQHVYALPSGYHLSGKSEDEFAEIMCKNAKESFNDFLNDIDTEGVNIRMVLSKDDSDDLTSDIRDLAVEIDVDAIIVGSKGRTTTAAFLLGSFAEKLITNTSSFRLLVVRKKNEYDGIFDRIKKL